MGLSLSHRSQFSFRGSTFAATSVSVEAPSPEIVNMTGLSDPKDATLLVPTGAIASPGRISVDAFGFSDPKDLVGKLGTAAFTTPLGTVSSGAVCESASVEGQVANLLRIRFSLLMTSYTE